MNRSQDSSELDITIREVKGEFKHFLTKRKELIIKMGTAYEKVVANPESICEEIKNVLRDEIAQKLISSRDIERYCLDKWKTKTKPKNDNLSFSKQVEEKPQPKIAMTTEGKPVSYNEPTAYAETSTVEDSSFADPVQKLLPHRSDKPIVEECSSCLELQDKVIELSEALTRTSIKTADQIPSTEFEFTIPKEKYEMVRDAMDKSKGSIFVKCDESRTFVRADPDVNN
jgi:hypothetical protein